MSTKENRNLVQKATALFSAIAASSFLGLPVLAQTSPSSGNSSGTTQVQCVPATSQSQSSSQSYGSSQSNRSSMSSSMNSASRNTSTSSADDSNTPGSSSASDNSDIKTGVNSSSNSNVQEYPNQSDPRAGVNPSTNTANNDVTAGTTDSSRMSQSSTQSTPQSGDVQSGNQNIRSRTSTNQQETGSVNPAGPERQTGMSGSNSGYSASNNVNSNNQYYTNRNYSKFGPALPNAAGATSGVNARRLLDTVNLTDRSDLIASNSYGQTQSSNYNQQPYGSVTSGAQTNSQVLVQCPDGMVPSSQVNPGSSQYNNNQSGSNNGGMPQQLEPGREPTGNTPSPNRGGR